LGDDERRGEQQRREYEAVAGQGGVAAAVRGDTGDPGQRDREPGPGHRPHHAATQSDRHQRHQDRRTADEQRGVADTRTGDARVLEHDHGAVAERAPRDDPR
jgi:hypothetical protein